MCDKTNLSNKNTDDSDSESRTESNGSVAFARVHSHSEGQYQTGAAEPRVFRCPNTGAIVSSAAFCPSVTTCNQGKVRCGDGSCRQPHQCAGIILLPSACDEGYILCPMPTQGVTCAQSLHECPQDRICPLHAPVRCEDGACSANIDECLSRYAAGSTLLSLNIHACRDNAWATSVPSASDISAGSGKDEDDDEIENDNDSNTANVAPQLQPNTNSPCGTSVTCPANSPIKCYDSTCRINPNDCPAPPQCSIAKPILCSTGQCISRAELCLSTSVCPPEAPIRCAMYELGKASAVGCAVSVTECFDIAQDQGRTSNVPSQSTCPHPKTRCWDGSCQLMCASRKCSYHLPFLCEDGSCVRDSAECFSLQEEKDQNGKTLYCPEPKVMCHDGFCSPSSTLCRGSTDAYNTCPFHLPFRCEDGHCTQSSIYCPIYPRLAATQKRSLVVSTQCTDAAKPIQCLSGECVDTADKCAIVKPCPTNYARCPDGRCIYKPLSDAYLYPSACAANITLSCPPERPHRCQSGLCVATNLFSGNVNDGTTNDYSGDDDSMKDGGDGSSNKDELLVDPPVCAADMISHSEGCPGGTVKCRNGLCVASVSECIHSSTVPNGCPSDSPTKCLLGDCQAKKTDCVHINSTDVSSSLSSAPSLALTDTSDPHVICEENQVICASTGACMPPDKLHTCRTRLHCPMTHPYRCAKHGDCRRFPASALLLSALLPLAFSASYIRDNTCLPVVTCSDPYSERCDDGVCAVPGHCRPVWPCPLGYERCANAIQPVCVPTSAFDNEATNDTVQSTQGNEEDGICQSVSLSCSTSLPVLCWNGECKKDLSHCTHIDPYPATLTLSPYAKHGAIIHSSDSISCQSPYVSCFDGSCERSGLYCAMRAYWTHQSQSQTGSSNSGRSSDAGVTSINNYTLIPDFPYRHSLDAKGEVCPENLVLCAANGACLPHSDLCPHVRACPLVK